MLHHNIEHSAQDTQYIPTDDERLEWAEAYVELIAPDGRCYINIRHGDASDEIGKVDPKINEFYRASDLQRIARRALALDARGHDVYFSITPRSHGDKNAGAGTKEAVLHCWLLFVDADEIAVLDALESFPLTPSVEIASGGMTEDGRPKRHTYFALTRALPVEEMEALTAALESHLGGAQQGVYDASRILRVPGTHSYKYCGKDSTASPTLIDWLSTTANRYDPSVIWEHIDDIPEETAGFDRSKVRTGVPPDDDTWTRTMYEGENRGHRLCQCAGRLAKQGVYGLEAYEMLDALNQRFNTPPYDDAKVRDIVKRYCQPHEENDFVDFVSSYSPLSEISFPSPMGEAARYGLVGEIVDLIEPESEADPHAILLQVLTALGNVIGPDIGFYAEADFHAVTLYCVLVGETSKGRKGTSLGYIRRLLEAVEEDYWKNQTANGLSSGEGLIHAVRDERWGVDKDGAPELKDPGVDDKRRLIKESEFAQVLKVIERAGNTLSPTMRSLWDESAAQTLTKGEPQKATGAHVSIIGHITKEELTRGLGNTEIANGLANRFLFTSVRRSKVLPDGGHVDEKKICALGEKVKKAIGKRERELVKDGSSFSVTMMLVNCGTRFTRNCPRVSPV